MDFGTDLRSKVIAERRQHIEDTAKCVDCRTDQKTCRTGAIGQPGPEGLCCWSGRHEHRADRGALKVLLDELAVGGPVRTVAEIDPPPVLGPNLPGYGWLLHQDVWWYPRRRPAVRIASMDKPWRFNTARFVERRAEELADWEYSGMAGILGSPMGPGGDMAVDAFEREMDALLCDPVGWLRSTALMRALRKGLPGEDSSKGRALAVRAVHWNTCPMRKAHPGKLDRCVCIREGGRTVGATNDPAAVRRVPAREACVPEWTT